MTRFVLRAVFLVFATTLATVSFMTSNWVPAVASLLCIFWSIGSLWRLYRGSEQKVTRLLDAVDNNDGSFRFSVHDADSTTVNASLNRIAEILSRARAEVVRQERYFEHILNVVNTGILVLNSDGHIERTNRRALCLLEMEACTHLRRIADVSPELASLLAEGMPGDRHQVQYHHGNVSRTLNVHISEVTIRDRNLRVVAIDDIDRELDAREIDSWSRLTRVLTHEIMNSLSPITSLSDSLLRDDPAALPANVRQGLETISVTAHSLSDFVVSYRRLAHPAVPEPSLFDVRPFLERMISLARNFAGGNTCDITIDLCESDLMLYADEGMIAQVMLNLLKNSVQAINGIPEGHIRVKAYATPADEVIIEICNNGPQIPPEIAGRIFLPFFTTKADGTGIGLSLSKQIMRASGGTLTLRPYTDTGTDTIFTITFS